MRLLILTHAFPPSRSSNAKRPYYLAKGFLEAGWEVDIMTSHMGVRNGDEEILKHPKLRVFRKWNLAIHILNLLQDKWPWNRLFGMFCNLTHWPDMCAPWARSVFRTADGFQEYDRVLAFVLPASILLSGTYSGLVGPHWTFDFQESVTPQNKRFPRRSPLLRLLSDKLERLEKLTLHQAGRVVFTANSNRQAYVSMGLTPKTTAEHVPYFYDAAAFSDSGKVGSMFEIGYYGNFDLRGARNPSTFFTALEGFLKLHPEARERTRFVFHGTWLEEHTSLLNEHQLADISLINPSVSYGEYLEKLKTSPVLLLIVSHEHNLFMPSKIVDYFGARRPILAFVPNASEMHEVLQSAGMSDFVCDETDAEAGALALGKLWQRHLNQTLNVDSARTIQWSSVEQISRYARMLETPLNR